MLLPRGGELERRGLKGSAAAGLVVLGLLVLATVVGISTVRGITAQTAAMADSVSSAIDTAVSDLDADQEALESARGSIESPPPVAGENFLTHLTDGLDKPVGLASGLILGALIMYYLLKDGSQIRRSVVAKFDVVPGRGRLVHRRLLRDYGRGRTIMSASVAVFETLVALLLGHAPGVHHPGRQLHRLLHPPRRRVPRWRAARRDRARRRGIQTAVIMLVAVVASNLLLENFVEPKVMSRMLAVHPLVVLVVTALGGLVGGIVGLILAVPGLGDRQQRHRPPP